MSFKRGAYRAVPDTYSARLGAAYLLPVLEGLVLSAGGRINGVTVRDLIGGGDLLLAEARIRDLRRTGADLDRRPEHGLRERHRFGRIRGSWTACSISPSKGNRRGFRSFPHSRELRVPVLAGW